MHGKDFAKPRIILAPPVRGGREPLCSSDEARASRMTKPKKYAGMVERLQVSDGSPFSNSMPFIIHPTPDGTHLYRLFPKNPGYHMLRFLSLRLAKSLFPDNFVDMRELRISERKGKLLSAMYSEYVPDQTGVIPRRDAFFRKYYEADDNELSERIRDDAARAERESCPGLSGSIHMVENAGIIVPHPEANYHCSDGNVVFFEVLGLDFSKAFQAVDALAPGIGEPIVLLSMIYGVMLRDYTKRNPGYVSKLGDRFSGLDFDAITLSALCGLLEMTDSPTALQRGFFREIHTILYDVFDRAALVRDGLKSVPVALEYPVRLDPALK